MNVYRFNWKLIKELAAILCALLFIIYIFSGERTYSALKYDAEAQRFSIKSSLLLRNKISSIGVNEASYESLQLRCVALDYREISVLSWKRVFDVLTEFKFNCMSIKIKWNSIQFQVMKNDHNKKLYIFKNSVLNSFIETVESYSFFYNRQLYLIVQLDAFTNTSLSEFDGLPYWLIDRKQFKFHSKKFYEGFYESYLTQLLEYLSPHQLSMQKNGTIIGFLFESSESYELFSGYSSTYDINEISLVKETGKADIDFIKPISEKDSECRLAFLSDFYRVFLFLTSENSSFIVNNFYCDANSRESQADRKMLLKRENSNADKQLNGIYMRLSNSLNSDQCLFTSDLRMKEGLFKIGEILALDNEEIRKKFSNEPQSKWSQSIKLNHYLSFDDFKKRLSNMRVKNEKKVNMKALYQLNCDEKLKSFNRVYDATCTKDSLFILFSKQVSLRHGAIITVNRTAISKPYIILCDSFELASQSGLNEITEIEVKRKCNRLEIIIENTQQGNLFASNDDYLASNAITIKNSPFHLDDWEIYLFDLDYEESLYHFSYNSNWPNTRNFTIDVNFKPGPRLYYSRIFFNLDPFSTSDDEYYINISGWSDGYLLMNGHLIGRYSSVSLMCHLHIPKKTLLKGYNEIVIFELHKPNSEFMVRLSNAADESSCELK